jgi:hypothetical protein
MRIRRDNVIFGISIVILCLVIYAIAPGKSSSIPHPLKIHQNYAWADEGIVSPISADDAAQGRQLKKYLEIERRTRARYTCLTPDMRQRLYDTLAHHEVAGIDKLEKYDPEGILGFCFGRAMAAHLIALRMGLEPGSIRKIFIVGVLKYCEKKEWRFHVATIVKGEDGEWYAIDPTRGLKLNRVGDWIDIIRNSWDREKKATLYMTPPSAIIPDISHYPDKDKEKGEYIIELSFDPGRRAGFSKCSDRGVVYYTLDGESLNRHFMCAGSSEAARFDFGKVVINARPYNFNGFFEDLLNSLMKASRPTFQIEEPDPCQ